jgi:radical SAM protein with 4Fe4S-binding SPASM domain
MNWKPDTLWWIITGKCNLNCMHCYIEAPQKLYGQMTSEQAYFVVDKVMSYGIKNFFITGGEPFIRKDILNIFERIIDKGGFISGIDSNGTLINDTIITFLKGNNIFINISHDGINFTDNNRISIIEDKIIDSVKRLIESGVKTNINTSLNPENLQAIELLFDELVNLNINQWFLFTPFKTGNYTLNYPELTVSKEQEIYKIIYDKWVKADMPFDIRLGNTFDSKKTDDKWNKYVCEYFRNTITLFPDGQLTPCCKYIIHDDYDKFPNIFKHSEDEIFVNSSLADIKNLRMKEKLEFNKTCKACILLDKCNAGCRMETYLESKSEDMHDYRNCELMKKSFEIYS